MPGNAEVIRRWKSRSPRLEFEVPQTLDDARPQRTFASAESPW